MRVLGIDFGEKRVGLAMSDAMGILASPLEVIEVSSQQQAIGRIAEVIKRQRVQQVVVGMPLDMKGHRGPKAEAAEEFAVELENAIGMPVVRWDERLTTVQAERAMLEMNVSRAGRRSQIDKVAAAVLLQGYLDSRPRGEGS